MIRPSVVSAPVRVISTSSQPLVSIEPASHGIARRHVHRHQLPGQRRHVEAGTARPHHAIGRGAIPRPEFDPVAGAQRRWRHPSPRPRPAPAAAPASPPTDPAPAPPPGVPGGLRSSSTCPRIITIGSTAAVIKSPADPRRQQCQRRSADRRCRAGWGGEDCAHASASTGTRRAPRPAPPTGPATPGSPGNRELPKQPPPPADPADIIAKVSSRPATAARCAPEAPASRGLSCRVPRPLRASGTDIAGSHARVPGNTRRVRASDRASRAHSSAGRAGPAGCRRSDQPRRCCRPPAALWKHGCAKAAPAAPAGRPPVCVPASEAISATCTLACDDLLRRRPPRAHQQPIPSAIGALQSAGRHLARRRRLPRQAGSPASTASKPGLAAVGRNASRSARVTSTPGGAPASASAARRRFTARSRSPRMAWRCCLHSHIVVPRRHDRHEVVDRPRRGESGSRRHEQPLQRRRHVVTRRHVSDRVGDPPGQRRVQQHLAYRRRSGHRPGHPRRLPHARPSAPSAAPGRQHSTCSIGRGQASNNPAGCTRTMRPNRSTAA